MSPVAPIKAPQVERPTVGEEIAEFIPWIGFVFVAGPPIAFVAVPLLVLVLGGLIWAFALLFAVVTAFIAVMAALGFSGALLASPYLLIRRVRARRRVRADLADPAAHLVAVKSPQAVA